MTIEIKCDMIIPFVIELYEKMAYDPILYPFTYIVNSRTYFECKICSRYETLFYIKLGSSHAANACGNRRSAVISTLTFLNFCHLLHDINEFKLLGLIILVVRPP